MRFLRTLPLPLRAYKRRLVLTAIAVVGLALMLGLPSAALAATPTVQMYGVTSTGATTATVDGTVNPAGQATTVKVYYDLASSNWCQSFGFFGVPSFSQDGSPFSFTDNQDHEVAVDLSGLTAGEQYCAEIVATNADGSTPTNDGDMSFWTQGTPTAFTFDATSSGATTATIDGNVNPSGQATSFKVVYDTASSDWCSNFGASGTPAFSQAGPAFPYTDSNSHDVSVDLSGLTAGTGYCAEIVATNGSGSTPTDDGNQISWTQGAPSAFTDSAVSTGGSTATVSGGVNPAGQATTVEVVYDTASSTWCQNFGFSGTPAFSQAGPAFPFTDNTSHDVSIDLSGLTAGTQYCAEIVATNGSGSTPTDDGDQALWTQGLPSADTYGVNSTGATTATVGGDVNPAGQATTFQVVYDVASSAWCTSFGSSGTPAFSQAGPAFSFTDSTFHDVTVDLSGLTAGTQYCAEIVASNASGTTPTDDGQQAQWIQGMPAAFTRYATSTGATTATVNGSVNPAGQTTTFHVVYDTASSTWCSSFGSSGTPAFSQAGPAFPFTDSTAHDVSVDLSGLTAGTQYCAEIVASNASGTTPTNDRRQRFWTQGLPSAATDGATSTGATTATVDGSVNPAGQATTFHVVYDVASSSWCTSFGSSGTPSFSQDGPAFSFTDSIDHRVSADLSGLTAGTSYCAEIVATNPSGSTPTDDGNQVQWTQGTPSATTFDAFSTSATGATVEGQVNPSGQATTFKVVYDVASSTWCQNFGFSGTPAFHQDGPAFSFTDGTFHDVSVDLTGLTAGQGYCAEIVATNPAGSTPTDDGGMVSWTEGAPSAGTFDALPSSSTTATVDGRVNPAGQATTFKVVYDTASSTWCTSFGFAGTPSFHQDGPAFSFTDSTFHDVSVDLSGLTANTSYCGEIVATNGTGSTPTDDGNQVTWTQPASTPQHSLTVTKSGTGSGSVSSSPSGIDCGATCAANFDAGTQVTLTATPAAGSRFAGWSGACTGTGSCDVTLNSDTAVTATFTLQHTLTVTKSGTGSGSVSSSPPGIDCGATCAAPFDANTQVTLTATAAGGSTFAGWSGACTGTGTCVVTMNGDTAVTATFNTTPPATHTLTVSKSGTGSGGVTSSPAGIDCGSTCVANYNAGTQVTLTATAAAGSTFAGWSGACTGTGSCVVTMNSDTAVTATFNTTPPVTHTLTVSKAGTGSGSVTSSPAGIDCGSTCSGSYNDGTQVTLTATSDSGSAFTGWSGACTGTSSTCVVTLGSDTTVTATFDTNPSPPPAPKCIVPKLEGKTLAAAKTAIKKAHCSVGKITKVASSAKNRGKVVGQSPKPGAHKPRGTKVDLKVGK